jgi:hypothetical protein
VILIIIAASFVYTVQPTLAVVSQTVNKSAKKGPINPLFGLCNVDPQDRRYSVSASYVVEGTIGSANLSNNVIGQRDMNITIINNMTGLSGKLLLNQSAPTQTLAGKLLINQSAPTQLGSFNIRTVSTECLGHSGPHLVPSINPYPLQLRLNPPFGECAMGVNSTIYTIASVVNQTQILKNVSPQTEMKIIIFSDFIHGGLSGSLLIGHNQPISLKINAIDTDCKSSLP